MPSSRAWRSCSQRSRASWVVSVWSRSWSAAARWRTSSTSRCSAACTRALATSVAVRAPGSAAIAAWLASRAPSSSVRRAGARSSRAASRCAWSSSSTTRRSRASVAAASRSASASSLAMVRSPPTSPRWSRAAACRAPGAGHGTAETGTESVPVAGSASASWTPVAEATARACSSSTWSRATSSTSGINGAAARAAATSTEVASCSADCSRQLPEPGSQAGPPGVCLGDQRGGLQRGARDLVPVAGTRCHLLGGRPRGAGLLDQCGDPAVGPGEVQGFGHVLAGCLTHSGHHLAQPVVHLVQGPGGLLPAGHQPALDGGEPAGVEEALEQLTALLGVGPQEVGELALGEQDDLAELGEGRARAGRRPGGRSRRGGWTAWSSRPCCAPAGGPVACSVSVPDPRRFGRSHCGERVSLSRRPRRLTSRTTSGAIPSPAWSLRSPRLPPRAPGTCP